MRRLDPTQVQISTIAALGLDPQRFTFTSVEAIAASLRRAAGFLCPCAAASLVRGVVTPMRGLVSDLETTRVCVEDTLEQLVAHGDLLEYRDLSGAGSSAVVLYAAPCSFVPRTSGAVILIGISADQVSALPPDLEVRIENTGISRTIRPVPQERLREDLLQIGLIEVPYDRWTKSPTALSPAQHIAQYDRLLQSKPSSGEVPGLLILDPQAPVRYYRSRWAEPRRSTGRFVARRHQAYGAPLWCYAQLQDGQVQYLVDFPSPTCRWRGCDEAWHLQMAIDANRQAPQAFDLRAEDSTVTDLYLYSPIPAWSQRRWDAIGRRIEPHGCLLAYRFSSSEVDEEIQFARSSMWLQMTQDRQ